MIRLSSVNILQRTTDATRSPVGARSAIARRLASQLNTVAPTAIGAYVWSMPRRDRLLARFERFPADFTWDELVRLLRSFGYEQATTGRTGGSRVRFVRAGHPPINLHRPHPANIVKRYQLRQVHEFLRSEGLLRE